VLFIVWCISVMMALLFARDGEGKVISDN